MIPTVIATAGVAGMVWLLYRRPGPPRVPAGLRRWRNRFD